jgi:hypothetical protein
MDPDDAKSQPVKYCPECGGEFVPDLETCPDCGVALAAAPPAEPSHSAPVEIFSSADRTLLPLVRAILSEAGIEHQEIERNLSAAIIGEITHVTVVLVHPGDAERATALLEQMDEGKPQLPY